MITAHCSGKDNGPATARVCKECLKYLTTLCNGDGYFVFFFFYFIFFFFVEAFLLLLPQRGTCFPTAEMKP